VSADPDPEYVICTQNLPTSGKIAASSHTIKYLATISHSTTQTNTRVKTLIILFTYTRYYDDDAPQPRHRRSILRLVRRFVRSLLSPDADETRRKCVPCAPFSPRCSLLMMLPAPLCLSFTSSPPYNSNSTHNHPPPPSRTAPHRANHSSEKSLLPPPPGSVMVVPST
jgi:hypothetical protein